ncbi:unnamed protein product, partial [Laminaria digitata]
DGPASGHLSKLLWGGATGEVRVPAVFRGSLLRILPILQVFRGSILRIFPVLEILTAHTPSTRSIQAFSTAHNTPSTPSISDASTAILPLLPVRNILDTPRYSEYGVSSILGASVQPFTKQESTSA